MHGTEMYLLSDLLLLCLLVESPEAHCLLYRAQDPVSHISHLLQDNASVQKKKNPLLSILQHTNYRSAQ